MRVCVRVCGARNAPLQGLTSRHRQVVKDCENLRSNVKRGLRSVDGLPALWLAKGGLTVGGAGQQLPSFPGGADAALQVMVLRSLYLALPEHFRKCKNAMDAAASWRTRVGLCEPGAQLVSPCWPLNARF